MAAATSKGISESSAKILALTDKIEDFLSADNSHSSQYTGPLKNLYDISQYFGEDSVSSTALPELIVSDFDDEQIWQQLELENESSIADLLNGAAKIISSKRQCSFRLGNSDSVKLASKSKKKKEKSRKGAEKDENVGESEINNKVSKIRKKLENSKTSDEDFGELNIEDNDSVIDDEDDELAKIENNLDEIDKNDKFFDFTGDSDEDLNFDFGPLGQKSDLDEELFDDDEEESESRKSSKSKKKSVTFKDEADNENETGSNKKGSKKKTKKNTKKGSIVDDAFFKLSDLEQFLDQEDKREERRLRKEKKEEESDTDDDDDEEEYDVDMFGEIESEEEDAHYDDFFDPPDGEVDRTVEDEEDYGKSAKKTKQQSLEENEEENYSSDQEDEQEDRSDEEMQTDKRRHGQDLFAESESEGEDIADILGGKKEEKSSYEIRQERLKKKISAMEESMLAEKPWQLAGEVSAGKRPENSLLQENLQFEHTTRLPPEITEETTKTLEELIKQRIKDKAWDDVERKVKPKDNPFEYKKRITLDQEKSKLSLSQIYEQEYLKQQKSEETEKADPDHDEIKKMMQSLFIKLDALSNFHYTPKQASAEVTVITNQPSISMEEVAPVSVSDGQLLAPEEIKNKELHDVKGTTERTKSDRLKERKRKKKMQRVRQKEREKKQKIVEKLNPGLGNKYSKEKALRQLEKESKSINGGVTLLKGDKKEKTGLTSSKAFFTQLQEEVTTGINRKKHEGKQKGKQDVQSGKKFKL